MDDMMTPVTQTTAASLAQPAEAPTASTAAAKGGVFANLMKAVQKHVFSGSEDQSNAAQQKQSADTKKSQQKKDDTAQLGVAEAGGLILAATVVKAKVVTTKQTSDKAQLVGKHPSDTASTSKNQRENAKNEGAERQSSLAKLNQLSGMKHSQVAQASKAFAASQAATASQIAVTGSAQVAASPTDGLAQHLSAATSALLQHQYKGSLLNEGQAAAVKQAMVTGQMVPQSGASVYVATASSASQGVQVTLTSILQGNPAITPTITPTITNISMQMSGEQSSNSKGERDSMRQAASMLASASLHDVRNHSQTFSAHLAYRSAQAFSPHNAMFEVAKAAKEGMKKLELQLEPASLGKIQITLQMDASKQIQVHMLIDQSASKQMLEQQLPQLRQALADQGLNLSGFTMDMNSQQRQGGHGSSHGSGQGFARQGSSQINIESLDLNPAHRLSMGINTAADGRLNILA